MDKKEHIVRVVRDAAYLLGGEFDTTQAGVPRIILRLGPIKASVVYVARSDQWKMFTPFPSDGNQTREYFGSFRELVDAVKERRRR